MTEKNSRSIKEYAGTKQSKISNNGNATVRRHRNTVTTLTNVLTGL